MVDKIKISEIANEFGVKNKDIVDKAAEIGIEVKATSSISLDIANRLANYILTGVDDSPKEKNKTQKSTTAATQKKQEKAEVKKEQPLSSKKAEVKKEKAESEIVAEKENKIGHKSKDIDGKESESLEKESLAEVSLKRRRGLVFVKKKRDEKINKEPKEQQSTTSTLADIFSNTKTDASQKAFELKKKKKITKKINATSRKDVVSKVDFLENRDMGESSYDPDEDLVVLPDLTFTEINIKEEVKPKKNNISQVKTVRQNPFLEYGIQRRSLKRKRRRVEEKINEKVSAINIPEDIRVYEFADKLSKQPSEVIKVLFNLGLMVTKNDFLDKDAIEILAEEFAVEVNIINEQEAFDYVKAYEEVDNSSLIERAPIITIMGHVDHGKTSLLDYIRSSKVASGEAGGITQHVGAYMVNKNGKNITFIDTPGHEAFTEMRARGTQITDIVIIVVAADDGVKQQTKEAISHAKAANVPMIIAVNKIDKPTANPDQVKSQLAEIDIMPVDWGGEYEFVHISAKTGEGIDNLLDTVLLQSEIMELKADPSRSAKATVVESSMEKGRGPVATIIVENGTLVVGDTIVAGVAYGKVKALLNAAGKNIQSIKPGEPGIVVGLSEVPNAGETVVKVENDKIAREYANKRAEYLRQKELSKSTKVSIDELGAMIAEGELKSLPIILKADVQGSLEAIKSSLEKLKNEETKVNIVHSGIGGITENDIALASATEHGIILGFNVRPTGSVKEKAKNQSVEIKTYKIIYNLLDDVKMLLSGMMAPIIREENMGQAEVREVFVVPKIGAIAGCLVTDGSINRGAKIRVIRDGIIIYEGVVSSLKRFKDDVREVAKGYECGIGVEGFNDIKVGDYLESFKLIEEQNTYDAK